MKRDALAPLAVIVVLAGCPGSVPDDGQFGGPTSDVAAGLDTGSVALDVATVDGGPSDAGTADADNVDDGSDSAGEDASGPADGGSGCSQATDCPKPGVPCRVATCKTGVCGGAKAIDGTACSSGKACQNGSCIGQTGYAQDVVAGHYFNCALLSGGQIACWGSNQEGQLGNGEEGIAKEKNTPQVIEGLSKVTAMSAYASFACAVTKAGKVHCWGSNYWGQLGNGESGPEASGSKPGQVNMLDDAIAVASGERHACALRAAGEIWCWGHNGDGQLGNGGNKPALGPIGANGSDWVAVAAGGKNTCGIRADGSVACWGDNEYGQCGNGDFGNQKDEKAPVTVKGISDAVRITVGERHACVRNKKMQVWCWGGGKSGQIGDGKLLTANPKPTMVKLPQTLDIAAGYLHTCARTAANILYCWGNNYDGQVGPGGDSVGEPAKHTGVLGAMDVTAGYSHSCMLRSDLSVWCWGAGGSGQLGNGADKSSAAPVAVKTD